MAGLFESFKNASPGRQVAMALGAALILGLTIGAIYFAFVRKSYEVLYADLQTAEAASIVAELEENNIAYRLADGGRTILAPSDVADATRLKLAGGEQAGRGLVGFEVFNRSDMGLTEFAQRINYQRALQGELTRTIMAIDGIESARVHLSISEPSVFRADRIPPKASVSLVPRARRAITPELTAGIQRLVASAVPELTPEAVVVVDETGAVVSALAPAAPAPPLSPEAQEMEAVAAYYAARIQRALGALSLAPEVSVSALVGDADRNAALQTWAPEARSFSLRVILTFPDELDPTRSEQARATIVDVIGDALPADSIDFAAASVDEELASPPAPAPSVARTRAPEPTPAAPRLNPSNWLNAASDQVDEAPLFVKIGAPLAALIMALGAFGLMRRSERARALSEREKERLARKFKTLLVEGGTRVESKS